MYIFYLHSLCDNGQEVSAYQEELEILRRCMHKHAAARLNLTSATELSDLNTVGHAGCTVGQVIYACMHEKLIKDYRMIVWQPIANFPICESGKHESRMFTLKCPAVC